ncbi:Long chain acyl-CoA synthetase 7, peroxisomal [Pelomyxa schiedti]|nr:Long chain acyl-CoA synthetase 7, peroxisomal [Pelomyxa schiedti]
MSATTCTCTSSCTSTSSVQEEETGIIRNPATEGKDLAWELRPDVHTVGELVRFAVNNFGGLPSFGKRDLLPNGAPQGDYHFLNYTQWGSRVDDFAAGLITLGLTRADMVCIWAINRMEWTLTDYACALHGIVTVPLYDSLGVPQMGVVLNETESKVIVASADKVKIISQLNVPHVRFIVSMDTIDPAEVPQLTEGKDYRLLNFSEVEEAGAKARAGLAFATTGAVAVPRDPTPDDAAFAYPEVQPTDPYTIIYTSGTTGSPKGVVLSHRNILAGCTGVTQFGLVGVPGKCSYVSYLPLAHVLERLLYLIVLLNGARCGFYSGATIHLVSDVQALRPTHFFGVPRVFNRMYTGVSNQVMKQGWLKRAVFNSAYWWKESCLLAGYDYNWNSWLNWGVFGATKNGMGGNVELILSGSAPLSADVQRYLSIVFCSPVSQGYGMTEAYPISLGLLNDLDPKQCGPPMTHVEVKLRSVPELGYSIHDLPNPRGEIFARGPHVFSGYFKHPELTAEVLSEDGWYRTGDIVELLPGNRISVIDRKKDIFKLSQGEFISAENVECKYLLSRYVAQILVYGDASRSCLVALVSPNEPVLAAEYPHLRVEPPTTTPADSSTPPPMIDYSRIDAAVEQAVLEDLKQVHAAAGMTPLQRVHAVRIVPPFSVENGMLTPTQKAVRTNIKKAYLKEIEAMYGSLEATKSLV